MTMRPNYTGSSNYYDWKTLVLKIPFVPRITFTHQRLDSIGWYFVKRFVRSPRLPKCLPNIVGWDT